LIIVKLLAVAKAKPYHASVLVVYRGCRIGMTWGVQEQADKCQSAEWAERGLCMGCGVSGQLYGGYCGRCLEPIDQMPHDQQC